MLTAIGTWIISTLLPILLQWLIIQVFLGACTWVVNEFFIDVVIKGGFRDFTGLTTYLSSLATNIVANGGASIDIFATIRVIAIFIIAINMIISGIRMMIAPATGRTPESPVAFFTRCAVAIGAIVLYRSIIDFVVEIMNAFLASPLFDVKTASLIANASTSEANGLFATIRNIAENGLGGIIIGIVISIVFLKDIMFAAIIYIERYASFALYLLLGPICIALYPSEAQKNVFGEWLKGILAQMITILLSIMCITLFCRQVYSMGNMSIGSAIGANATIQLVFAMTLLELVKNSEQIVSMFGFRTIPSGDTAKMFLGGVAGAFADFQKAGAAVKKGESNWNDAKAKTFGTGQAPKFESKNIAMGGSEMGVSMKKTDSIQKLAGADAAINAINKNGGAPLSKKQMDDLAKNMTQSKKFYESGNNALKDKYGLGTKDYDEVRKGIEQANNQYKSLNETLSSDHPDAQACLNMRNNSNGLVGVGQASKLYFPPDKKGFSEANPNDDGSFMQGYIFKAKKAGQKDSDAETYVQYQQVRRNSDGTIVPVQNADPNLMREAQSAPIVPHQRANEKARENIVNNIRNKDEYKGLTDDQLQSNPTYQAEVAHAMENPNVLDQFAYDNQIANNKKAKENIENSVRNSDKYKGFTDEQLQNRVDYQEDLQKAYNNSGIQGENTYSMPTVNTIGNKNENGQLMQLGVKELHGNEELCTNFGTSETPFDYARQEFVQNENGEFELKTTLGNEISIDDEPATSYSLDEKGNLHSTTKIDITGSFNTDKELAEADTEIMQEELLPSVDVQPKKVKPTLLDDSRENKVKRGDTIYTNDRGESSFNQNELHTDTIYAGTEQNSQGKNVPVAYDDSNNKGDGK